MSSRSRLVPLLTRRGFGILSLLPALALLAVLAHQSASTTLGLSGLLLLIFLLFGAVDYYRSLSFARNLKVSAECRPQIYERAPYDIVLNFSRNADTSLPSTTFIIRLDAAPQLVFTDMPRTVNLVDDAVAMNFHFEATHRGDFEIRRAWIRARSKPGSFFQWQFSLPLEPPLNFRVLPNPLSQTTESLKSLQQIPGSAAMAAMAGRAGREFDRLRAYSPRDDLRAVDWKRSAHRGSLVIRVFRPETHQRVSLLVDCSRRMGTSVEKKNLLDVAIDSAATLTYLSEQHEDEIGLFAFHHRVVTAIPARRGRAQRHLLLNSLSTLTPGALEPDYRLLSAWQLQNPRRSLAVLLTTFSSTSSLDRLIPAVLSLRTRHLPLVVAIADRSVAALRSMPARNETDAFIVAAAQQHTDRIHERLAALRSHGVEALYGDARDVAHLVQQKYYQLKVSGRL